MITMFEWVGMDIKEIIDVNGRRHPWETSRLRALKQIVKPHLFEGMRVLDIGCGDGFICRHLFSGLRSREVVAVDTHLTAGLRQQLMSMGDGITYQRELPEQVGFDLLLLLDVVEHQRDDADFVRDLATRFVGDGGILLITVPAFQSLFGPHDVFLGHYRRYTRRELIALATAAGLDVIESGYLFFSLLLPKLLFFKLLTVKGAQEGVGNWRGGRLVTLLAETLLRMDNALLLAAGRLGITLPGLTGWMVCKKPG